MVPLEREESDSELTDAPLPGIERCLTAPINMTPNLSRGRGEEEKETTVKPFMEIDTDQPPRIRSHSSMSAGDESPATKVGGPKLSRAAQRWKMLAAVIRDPVLMNIISQSGAHQEVTPTDKLSLLQRLKTNSGNGKLLKDKASSEARWR